MPSSTKPKKKPEAPSPEEMKALLKEAVRIASANVKTDGRTWGVYQRTDRPDHLTVALEMYGGPSNRHTWKKRGTISPNGSSHQPSPSP